MVLSKTTVKETPAWLWKFPMFSGETSILRSKVFLRPMHWKWYAALYDFHMFMCFNYMICYARLLSMACRNPLRREIEAPNWLAAIVKDCRIALASMGFILVFKLYRWNWTAWRSCCCCFEWVYSMELLCHAQSLELEAILYSPGNWQSSWKNKGLEIGKNGSLLTWLSVSTCVFARHHMQGLPAHCSRAFPRAPNNMRGAGELLG